MQEAREIGGSGSTALMDSRSILRSAFDVDAGGSGPALRRAHADVDHVSEAESGGYIHDSSERTSGRRAPGPPK